jgi:hypothetical protein
MVTLSIWETNAEFTRCLAPLPPFFGPPFVKKGY